MDELKAIIQQISDADPAFAQPWQADAFVIAVALSQRGWFSWPLWVAQFAEVIRDQPQRNDESPHDAYYRQWLSCLQIMLSQHQLISVAELLSREAQWRQAFLNTPHGSPVELAAAHCPPASAQHHHYHDHPGAGEMITAVARPLRVFAAQR